ncbi:hypothetical protein [Alienimonas chondri]|uniref:HEAT repeat domain-containing protein n=1 Tax=Alienimonas chondri TaxID=2681879 RepID=A0ABX1VER4_9PLAN|nr:hypothetical protein [Alienimonas chondri]NNJ26589.1 hypothetical protein [Alienimonas chondri]
MTDAAGRPLSELDAVDWAALTHAYGSAENVPAALRRLASDDPADWVRAADELTNCLCHQLCDVYEATAPAVPFLIGLLNAPAVRCRGKILELLGHFAGVARSNLSGEWGAQDEDVRRDAAATLDAVRAGSDAMLDLLAHPDPRLRLAAPFTLVPLCSGEPEDVAALRRRAVDRMTARLAHEPLDLARAGLVFGLSELAAEDATALEPVRPLIGDDAEAVRVAAALAIAKHDADPSDAVVDVLRDTLNDWKRTDRLFRIGGEMETAHHPIGRAVLAYQASEEGRDLGPEPDDAGALEDLRFPWFEMWPRFTVIAALCRLPDRRLPDLAPTFAAAIAGDGQHTTENVTGPILRRVLGDVLKGPEADGVDLTAPQRAVLAAAVENDALWGTNSGNVIDSLHSAGLTDYGTYATDRARLRALLDRRG